MQSVPMASRLLLLAAFLFRSQGVPHPFVPACIAERCRSQAIALGGDNYTKALGKCASDGFGQCGNDAWNCLGDEACRSVLTCAPKVFRECKGDIWKMLTDPKEREKIECLQRCIKDGHVNLPCAVAQCGKSSVQCLFDSTCRHTLECVPKTLLSCSKSAFGCVFGKSSVCRQNAKCLGHGVADCWAPVVNLGTDTHIADFMDCASRSCPAPEALPPAVAGASAVSVSAQPSSAAEQLLCVASKCGEDVLRVLGDSNTKGLLTCALDPRLHDLCPAVWECLGDAQCRTALECWSKPLETCADDVWDVLTGETERARLERIASCSAKCQKRNGTDLVEEAFCLLDACGQEFLDCYHDQGCSKALKCMPRAVGTCAVTTLDANVHQPLFKKAAKCLGEGAKYCGRAAVEMLRDQTAAAAVRCAAQCTRPPQLTLPRRDAAALLV